MMNIIADHRGRDGRCGISSGDNKVSGDDHGNSVRESNEEENEDDLLYAKGHVGNVPTQPELNLVSMTDWRPTGHS